MIQTTTGLRNAIEAHFAEVDRLGVNMGQNRVVSTNIYVDNIKAFTIKSTKSKIGECKIYDPRIKMVLNVHPNGPLFLNSKYSHVFGESKERLMATLADILVCAMPDYTDNRVKFENVNAGMKPLLIGTAILTVFSIFYFIICVKMWGVEDFISVFCFTVLPAMIATFVSYKATENSRSTLISIIPLVIAWLIETILYIAIVLV